jgi:hypothetical protein
MSMTPEDLQALSEARGRPLTAPVTPAAVNPNLVTEASGLYGDTATSQYIRDLQAGVNVGAGTVEQRNAALNILIEQGKQAQTARDAASSRSKCIENNQSCSLIYPTRRQRNSHNHPQKNPCSFTD